MASVDQNQTMQNMQSDCLSILLFILKSFDTEVLKLQYLNLYINENVGLFLFGPKWFGFVILCTVTI